MPTSSGLLGYLYTLFVEFLYAASHFVAVLAALDLQSGKCVLKREEVDLDGTFAFT